MDPETKALLESFADLKPEEVAESLQFLSSVLEEVRPLLPAKYQIVALVILLLLNAIVEQLGDETKS